MTEQRKNGQNIPRGSGAGKEPHVIKIPLRLLDNFPKHPYYVFDDDDMLELMESINSIILNPETITLEHREANLYKPSIKVQRDEKTLNTVISQGDLNFNSSLKAISDLLSDRLSEIQKALDCKLYQSALSLALTVPDICGQINYPKDKTGKRYKKWFDKFVKDDYIYNPEYNQDYTAFTDGKYYFDGAACYALRCAFLHSGDDKVENTVFKGINDKEEINENTEIKYDFRLQWMMCIAFNHADS